MIIQHCIALCPPLPLMVFFSVYVVGGMSGQLFHFPWSTVEPYLVLIVVNQQLHKTLVITLPLCQDNSSSAHMCHAMFSCFNCQCRSCHPFALHQPPFGQPTPVSSTECLESWIFCVHLFLPNDQDNLFKSSGSGTVGPH